MYKNKEITSDNHTDMDEVQQEVTNTNWLWGQTTKSRNRLFSWMRTSWEPGSGDNNVPFMIKKSQQKWAPDLLKFVKQLQSTTEQLIRICYTTGDNCGTSYKCLFNNTPAQSVTSSKEKSPPLHPKWKGQSFVKKKKKRWGPPGASEYHSRLHNCLCYHSAAILIITTAGEKEQSLV